MMTDNNSIMLVEDDDLDANVLERFVKRGHPDVQFIRVANGADALAELSSDKPPPDLILMDINMPVMDGREALAKIKSDAKLRNIPVVMLSTSSNRDDIDYCYVHSANAYVVKPFGVSAYESLTNKLVDFWLDAAVH